MTIANFAQPHLLLMRENSFRLVPPTLRFKRFMRSPVSRINRRAWFRLKSRRVWFKFHYPIAAGLKIRHFYKNLYKFQFYHMIESFVSDTFLSNKYLNLDSSFKIIANYSYITYVSFKIMRNIASRWRVGFRGKQVMLSSREILAVVTGQNIPLEKLQEYRLFPIRKFGEMWMGFSEYLLNQNMEFIRQIRIILTVLEMAKFKRVNHHDTTQLLIF